MLSRVRPVFARGLGFKLVAPAYLQDFTTRRRLFSGQHLVRQTTSKGPKELGLNLDSMFFIQGAEDFTTRQLARSYLDSIKAPRKEL
jgi:hypothetical protein